VTTYAWVIDQTKCIGCHACTTACKSENDVPVGVFRTWVKNVDVGTFPAVRRHFAVLRCNHCADPPCVAICPVTAMYQRPDGLVDFDEDLCIGCKACMQACPYDAIYMDPDTHTAAKCNFCSHRVDQGLLPACVVVCPVEALLFGDLDDPTSKVSRARAANPVAVRRPEQRTRPMAFYIGAHEATLDPLAAHHAPTYMWAERGGDGCVSPTARPLDRPTAVVSYDIPRQRAWAGKVSSYIWTKSLAAGLAFVPAVLRIFGRDTSASPFLLRWLAPLAALFFLGVTGALLVADLKRPERFWTILVRPQWRSWLARGSFVITGYGAVLVAWLAATAAGAERALDVLAWPVAALALLTAIYTAFLFNQCEGRDLWQSPLLLVHLALHAPVAAIAAFLIAAPLLGAPGAVAVPPAWIAAGLTLLAALALGDAFGRHATANAAAAARALARGRYARLFWASLLAGLALPAALLAAGAVSVFPLVGVLTLAGLWLYGHALVLAGQGPTIS